MSVLFEDQRVRAVELEMQAAHGAIDASPLNPDPASASDARECIDEAEMGGWLAFAGLGGIQARYLPTRPIGSTKVR